ncbi:YncE family protein [Qipengyuania algicida]|uniref:YncE family protein n=1 Tax=Qipengyuania algicida TaxID=1836209 RepID=UPI0019252754|nr:gluconolactonase [Qipengyuania algicida]
MRNILLAVASIGLVAAAPSAQPYANAGSIALPDGAGWDYSTFDPVHDRLFVTHGDAVAMVDLAHGNSVHMIGSIHHGHAVVPIAGTDDIAVTSGHDATVRLINVVSGKQLASIAVPADPDAAIIDPASGYLLTMNADAGKVTEVDLKNAKIVKEIPLESGLEYAVIGPHRTLFVNNEDRNEIETVNLATGKPGTPIALPGCEGPTGMALDAAHDRVISSCANGVAEVVDVMTHKVEQAVPIGTGPDAVLVDPVRRLALIPCGKSGTLEVLDLGGAKVRKLASVSTEVGARTGALDLRSGMIYLPTAKFNPPSEQGKRPQAIAGSFHFLILKPQHAR